MKNEIEIGDRVKCINAKLQTPPPGLSWATDALPILEGRDYIVHGIRKCACGKIKIDVGFTSPTMTTACDCYQKTTDGAWWFNSSRFRKIEPKYKVVEVSETINHEVKKLIYS